MKDIYGTEVGIGSKVYFIIEYFWSIKNIELMLHYATIVEKPTEECEEIFEDGFYEQSANDEDAEIIYLLDNDIKYQEDEECVYWVSTNPTKSIIAEENIEKYKLQNNMK